MFTGWAPKAGGVWEELLFNCGPPPRKSQGAFLGALLGAGEGS